MRPNQRGNFSLIGTLVAVALILLLAGVFLKGGSALGIKAATPSRPDGKGKTVVGAAQWTAKDTACRSNLNQLRQSITVFQTSNDDAWPATLEETKLGNDFYHCAVGGEAYTYDPATGKVSCPHPGHEKY